MTKFEGTFSGHTTGDGGKVLATIATVGVVGALAFESLKGAASTIGSIVVIGATAFVAAAVTVTGIAVFLRLRGRGRNETAQQVSLMRQRTDVPQLPPREARAIAAPAQPVININLGPDLAAYFREQAVPVYRVTAETVEQQQEIQR